MINIYKNITIALIFMLIGVVLLLPDHAYSDDMSYLRVPLIATTEEGQEKLEQALVQIGSETQASSDRWAIIARIRDKEYSKGSTVDEVVEDYRQLLHLRPKFDIFEKMTDKINLAIAQKVLTQGQILSRFAIIHKAGADDIELWIPCHRIVWNEDDYTLLKSYEIPIDYSSILSRDIGSISELFFGELKGVMPDLCRQILLEFERRKAGFKKRGLICILGASATFKSTLARESAIMYKENSSARRGLVIETDDYKYARAERKSRQLKGEDAIDRKLLLAQLESLFRGEKVELRKVDKRSQEIGSESVDGHDYDLIILEGAYAWYWSELQKLADLKVMLLGAFQSRLLVKSDRDERERSYDYYENLCVLALSEIEEAPLIIQPQISQADIVIDLLSYFSRVNYVTVNIYRKKNTSSSLPAGKENRNASTGEFGDWTIVKGNQPDINRALESAGRNQTGI